MKTKSADQLFKEIVDSEKRYLERGIKALQFSVENMPYGEYQSRVEMILDEMQAKLEDNFIENQN
jgi:hypothetical protein